MIALNYHQVTEQKTGSIYTISPRLLARHLAEIQKHCMNIAGVDDVLQAKEDDTLIMLHFDDGTSDHFDEVFPLLESNNAKGVFFISAAKINQPGYLTQEQVRRIADAGHNIECHGNSHHRMDRMSREELNNELTISIQKIKEWTGRAPRILAPPGGYCSQHITSEARSHGLEIIRTMRWNTNNIPLNGSINCLVVTSMTSDSQFSDWLHGKGIIFLRIVFWLKQILRTILPFQLYLIIRQNLSKRISQA
ncbi:MAG: polysaccharide deacetylase family protein [Akkermansiaceae bacterium]|jgi:peptidoglycan/xylan/chitin deacetylase (PgdA/CDA1 family)